MDTVSGWSGSWKALPLREAKENYESGCEGIKPFSESLFKALLLILRSLVGSLYATNKFALSHAV
jgi:hypothetical protein